MPKKILHKNLAITWCALLLSMMSPLAFAQQNTPPAMADALRSSGKIYVVVLVLITIFAGIIFYLVSLDRKISRQEKDHHSS